MSNFITFKMAVNAQMTRMTQGSNTPLFQSSASKDALWATYLGSFKPGTDPIYRERSEHDCQCCKQFIRACGGMVFIEGKRLTTIWDVDVGGIYQPVADALSALVRSSTIRDIYLHSEKNLGTDFNHSQDDDGQVIKWNHFYFELPAKFVKRGTDIGPARSEARSSKDVFKRALDEITYTAIETVIELIEQNSLYRGSENLPVVELLLAHKGAYDQDQFETASEKDAYTWLVSSTIGGAARVRNTSIGTLLVDLSEGVELDRAVKSFEAKVAPENYKRPTALGFNYAKYDQ